MQQADLGNLIHMAVNSQPNIKTQPQQANAQTNPAQNNNTGGRKFLNAAKEVGITAGMGITGGALVGGITSLIPVNADVVSDELCDTFIKSSLKTMGLADSAPNLNFNNAKEQLEKATEYIKAGQVFDNLDLSKDDIKNAEENFSNATSALKQSAIEYLNKAPKGDEILKFAKKQAKKLQIAENMKSSISIGVSTAFIVLLFNILGGMFSNKSKQNNSKNS